MTIDPIIFYLIAGTSVLISGAFLILAVTYTKVLKRVSEKEKEIEMQRALIRDKALQLVEEGRQKSLQIIQEANKTAASIIEQATITSQFSEKELRATLAKIQEEQSEKLKAQAQDFLAQFHTALEGIKKQDVDTMQLTSQQVQEQALIQIENFRHTIEDKTLSSQEKIATEMEKQYNQLKLELEQYKLKQMKKVDESIFMILMYVSKQILGKALNIEDHQDLVMKTLQDAKKRGDFDRV